MPVWADLIAQFCAITGFNFLNGWLPTYLDDTLGFSLENTGYLSALPMAAYMIVSMVTSVLNDWIIAKKLMKRLLLRKICQIIGCILPALFLLLIAYSTKDRTLIVMYMALYAGSIGPSMCGYSANFIEVSPQHIGFIFGIANTAGQMSGVIGFPVSGLILEETGSWTIIFVTLSALYVFSAIQFTIFASDEDVIEKEGKGTSYTQL